MLLVVILFVLAVLNAALVVVLLRNELRVKRTANEYAFGATRKPHIVGLDERKLGA